MNEEKDNKESEEQQSYIIIPSTAFKKDKKKITSQATKVAKLVSTLALLEMAYYAYTYQLVIIIKYTIYFSFYNFF